MALHYLDLFDCGLFDALPDDETGRDTRRILDAVRMTLLRNVMLDIVTVIPAQWACTSYAFFTAIPECAAPYAETLIELSRQDLLNSRNPVQPIRIACPPDKRSWLEDAAQRYSNPATPLFGLPGGDPRTPDHSRRSRAALGECLERTVQDVQRKGVRLDIVNRLTDQIEDRVLAQSIIDSIELSQSGWETPFDASLYFPTYSSLVSTVSELIRHDAKIRRTGDPLVGTYEQFFNKLAQRDSFNIPDLFEIARDFSPREEASILNVGRALLAHTLRGCVNADQVSYSGALLNPATDGFDSQLVRRTIRLQQTRFAAKSDSVRQTSSTSGLPSHVWRNIWTEVWRFKLGRGQSAFHDDINAARDASNEITRGRHLQRAINRVVDAMPCLDFDLIDNKTGLLSIKLGQHTVKRFGAFGQTVNELGVAVGALAPTIASAVSGTGAWGSLLASGIEERRRRKNRAGLKRVLRFA